MILAAAGIQCFHFCVYDPLFLVQSNFKAGQIISEQLYSSAVPTHSAAFMAKEDHNVLQIREALMSLGLTDGEKILPDSHPIFKQDCCGSSDATIFPHAEKSTGHLAIQLMAGNKVAKELHYFMCECPYHVLAL